MAEILYRESDNMLMTGQRKSEQEPAGIAMHLQELGGADGISLPRIFPCLGFRVTGKCI